MMNLQDLMGGGRRFNWSRDAWFHAASKVEDAAASKTDEGQSSQNETHGRRTSADAAHLTESGPESKTSKAGASNSAEDGINDGEPVMHLARLLVDAEIGAGLEISWAPGQGYLIEGIADPPGQPELQVGDMLVAINSISLGLSSEDAADEVLAAELRDGAEVVLYRGIEVAEQNISEDAASGHEAPCQGEAASAMVGNVEPLGKATSGIAAEASPQPVSESCDASDESKIKITSTPAEDASGQEANPDEPTIKSSQGASGAAMQTGAAREEATSASMPTEGAQEEASPKEPMPPAQEPLSSPTVTHEAARGDASSEEPDCTSAQAPMPELVPLPGLRNTDPFVHRDPWSTRPAPQCHVGSASVANDWVAPVVDTWVADESISHGTAVVLSSSVSSTAPLHRVGGSQASCAGPPKVANAARCKILNLWEWMVALNLDEYYEVAVQWCVDMGAASLQELAENSEDFAESAALKPIERKRLARWAAGVNAGDDPFPGSAAASATPISGSGSGQTALMPYAALPYAFPESQTCQRMRVPEASLMHASAPMWVSDGPNPRATIPSQNTMISFSAGQRMVSAVPTQYDSLSMAHLSRPSGSSASSSSAPSLHQAFHEVFRNDARVAAEDPSVLGPGPSGLRGDVTLYSTRKVNLKVDSEKGAGLDVFWNAEWGYVVQKIAPTPGQPDLKLGDFIIAINGHSLRHRTNDEVDEIFGSQFAPGAMLTVANPHTEATSMAPAPAHVLSRKGINRTPGLLVQQRRGLQQAPQLSQLSHHPPGVGWSRGMRGKGRRSGYDPNRMWQRFRGPPW